MPFSTVCSGPQFISISIMFIVLTPWRTGRLVCLHFLKKLILNFIWASQSNCLCVCLHFQLFLKNDYNFLGVPFLCIFLLIFVYCYFFIFPYFLRTIQSFFSTFCACIFYYSGSCLRNFFHNVTPFVGSYFSNIFGYVPLFLDNHSIFFHEITVKPV